MDMHLNIGIKISVIIFPITVNIWYWYRQKQNIQQNRKTKNSQCHLPVSGAIPPMSFKRTVFFLSWACMSIKNCCVFPAI